MTKRMSNGARLVGAGLVVVVLASIGVGQKTPDARVDRAPGASLAYNAETCSAGSSVYVVWQDRRDGAYDVYLNRSEDAGETWMTSDLRLDTDAPGAADSYSPRIAAAGRNVYVVWNDYRNGVADDIYFNRSTDGGVTWLASDVRLDTDTPGATRSAGQRIAVDGARVYVVWGDYRSGVPQVYLRYSTDSGQTWGASDLRVDSSPSGTTCLSPRIALDGKLVYVVWSDDRNGPFDIRFNRSTNGGVSWAAGDVRLDTTQVKSNSESPEIAASERHVYVVWDDERSGPEEDIYFNRSTDQGKTWLTNDVRLDTDLPGAAGSYRTQLANSGSDVHVVWFDDRNGARDIFYNRSWDRGATWLATDMRLDTDAPGASHSDDHQMDCAGDNVYVVWMDQRNGQGDIHFNRSTDRGATWLAADVQMDRDGPGTTWSYDPDIDAGGTQPFVVWDTFRPGPGRQVYFNIAFGFQPYGVGKPGSGGIAPQLVGTGFSTLGSEMALLFYGGLGAAPGVVLLGGGSSARAAQPFQGGTLWVKSGFSAPIFLSGPAGAAGVGSTALPLNMPADPTYVGLNLNFQAVFLDLGAPFGLSMTNAVETWIG